MGAYIKIKLRCDKRGCKTKEIDTYIDMNHGPEKALAKVGWQRPMLGPDDMAKHDIVCDGIYPILCAAHKLPEP